jgi:peptidoglycan/xylan/chitin deacetylase (PgdA/CDA1 family)
MRPPRPRSERPALASPWVTASLAAVVVVLIAAAVALPSLMPAGSAGASETPIAPTDTAGPTLPSVAPTFVRPTPSPEPTFTSYRVQAGDSLNSIARAFHTTARSIAWWNRGTYPSLDPESESYDPNHIQVGWLLTVMPNSVVDETNPPTPSPGPPSAPPASPAAPTRSPTPSAARTPGPPPTSAPAAATVISHGSRSSGEIALTFDMGGRLVPAHDIIQWLIDHDVHATIFPTGVTGSTTTKGVAALKLAASRPDLFDFGNHSWDHPDFRTLTAAQMASQLTSTETALAPILGTSTRPWFRPPYGGYNAAVRAAVGAAGWKHLVLWDVDTIDWKQESAGGPTTADIVAKIAANAQAGSIVLMHLGGYNTLDALPGILAAVQAKGLTPVTLGELFGE